MPDLTLICTVSVRTYKHAPSLAILGCGDPTGWAHGRDGSPPVSRSSVLNGLIFATRKLLPASP
jgi:hypothetical protein